MKLHRKYHVAQVYKNSMFVFGGVEQEDSKALNDVWILDLRKFFFSFVIFV